MIGISPEMINTYSLKANPFTEKKIGLQKTVEAVVNLKEGVQKKLFPEKELEAEKEKAMSQAEEIAWLVGKIFLPTLAVMAFSAAVVCPLAWVVAGSVLVGATAAGLVSFGYEQRKNSFKDPENKKSMDKIMRDVSIAAAINGVYAPFNMATAGLAQTIGPVTVKTILKTAAQTGAITFAGRTLANAVKGAVTNLWYDHYYNYDEKEKILKNRIETLTNIENRTPEQEEDLVNFITDLDSITKEKYTWKKFKTDEKSALIWAGVSGALGGAAGKLAGQTSWAKKVSSKLFGSVEHANTVANAVVSNPFAFATGASIAAVKRGELLNEIKLTRLKQKKYEKGSAAWNYYEEKTVGLEENFVNTSRVSEGKKAMISNAAMQSAVVGISLVQTRCFTLPSQKKQKVQEKFEEQDSKWQKANELKQKLEKQKLNKPLEDDYDNHRSYLNAMKDYGQQYKKLNNQYQQAKTIAASAQKTTENKLILKEIYKEVNAEIKFNQKTELARSLGQESYIDFKIKNYMANPENANLSAAQLREKAIAEIHTEYETAAITNASNLAQMKDKLSQNKQGALTGKVVAGNDGKRYVQITGKDGTVALKNQYTGSGGYWWNRFTMKDPAKMKQAEIDSAIKQIYSSGAMVKPSTFRNEFINMRLNQLRAKGMTETQIEGSLPEIIKEGNSLMSQNFGDNLQNIVKSEILAEGLARAKYDAGKSPDLNSIFNFIKTDLPAKTITAFQRRLKSGVAANLPSEITENHLFNDPDRDERLIDQKVEQFLNDY
jgi:hypothetical protein